MRLPDATARLAALLHERAGQPFAWGTRDCCVFAFDAVLAATGRDVFVDLRGSYRSATTAMRQLRRLGGLHGLCAARLGPEVTAAQSHDGDVVLLSPEAIEGSRFTGALAVTWNGHLVAQGGDGLVVLSRDFGVRFWRAHA